MAFVEISPGSAKSGDTIFTFKCRGVSVCDKNRCLNRLQSDGDQVCCLLKQEGELTDNPKRVWMHAPFNHCENLVKPDPGD